jgi:hypothetical protein
MLMTALPITTNGCRALLERRVGISTVSGSIAVRGLRGVMGLVLFELIGTGLIPFTCRSESGGYGSPAPGTAPPLFFEYGTDPRADPRSPPASRTADAAASGRGRATAATGGAGFAAGGRLLPLGGGSDPVTAAYPVSFDA